MTSPVRVPSPRPAVRTSQPEILRRKFLSARVGISGANFAIAETGTVCVVESSTGERMNPYTSMWTGVTPGDGPQQFRSHLITRSKFCAMICYGPGWSGGLADSRSILHAVSPPGQV